MLILATTQPIPLAGQAQIQAQLVQVRVGSLQVLQTQRATAGVGFEDCLLKVDKISAAPFRDRVVHHALRNLIEPIFDARFIAHSYANRLGKGTHRAVDQLQRWAQRYRYVLRMDVVQHFPSLDHAILRDKIARVIHDADVLWLVDAILASGAGVLADEYTPVYFPGDDLFALNRPRGLPIGNLTSQLWFDTASRC